jgi:hypothetical protein
MIRPVLLAAALAACGHGAKPAPIGNGSASGTPSGGGLALTATGLGPIHADTPATLDSLTKLFPDLVVASADYEHEDGMHTAFSVSRGTDLLFQIEHVVAKIALVEVYGAEIHSDTGLAPGQTFAAARTVLGAGLVCNGMLEEEGGNALCMGGGPFAVIVPMVDDGNPQPYGEAIPADRLDHLLGNSKVERVLWVPDSPDEGQD